MRLGPRFCLYGDVKSSSGGDGIWSGGEDGHVGRGSLNWFHAHGVLWWQRVHSRHLRINSPQGSRRMAPPQSSPFPLWPLSLVIYRWDRSSTSFTPKYGIMLQTASDCFASLEDPTGRSGTEAEFCADTRETNGVKENTPNRVVRGGRSLAGIRRRNPTPKAEDSDAWCQQVISRLAPPDEWVFSFYTVLTYGINNKWCQ